MTSKRHRVVPRDFDNQLAALASYIERKGFRFEGFEPARLRAAIEAQRSERQHMLALTRQADVYRDGFLAKQAQRYAEFIHLLNMLRATYARDSSVQRELAHFKRRTRRNGTGTGASAETDAGTGDAASSADVNAA